jgi:hypothetical protein
VEAPARPLHPRIGEVSQVLLDATQQSVIVWQVAGDKPLAWTDFDTAFSERLERTFRTNAEPFEAQPGHRHRFTYDAVRMIQTNTFYGSQRVMRRVLVPIDHWFSSAEQRTTVEAAMARMWAAWEAANGGGQPSRSGPSRSRSAARTRNDPRA